MGQNAKVADQMKKDQIGRANNLEAGYKKSASLPNLP
jgi:hypothetical protein